jgi:hypothetical protein
MTHTLCPDDHTVTRACMHGLPSRLHIFCCSPHPTAPDACTDSCRFSTALSRQSFASQHSVLLFGMRTVTSYSKESMTVSAFSSIFSPRFGKRKAACLGQFATEVEPVAHWHDARRQPLCACVCGMCHEHAGLPQAAMIITTFCSRCQVPHGVIGLS